jgi:serine/threonine protein kinase/Tfp pilus assembly protein PilF
MASEIRITAEDLFHRAANLTIEERASYLDRACSHNPALRQEVEELLSYDGAGESFLENLAIEDAARNLARGLSAREAGAEKQVDTLREENWTLGPYRIVQQIGKGGMGIVYLAVDTRNGREVAVKVLLKDLDPSEDRLARFSREGRMLAELKSIKHPNIAEIYEQNEYDGKPCIVLEYVSGETLAHRLRERPIPIEEVLQYALQIADALKTAHDHYIIHRDLKPANIKITQDGKIKILDFGIAKRFYDDPSTDTHSLSLTESGMLVGTPAYMSPEQWNSQPIDQRTDLWAFGCVMYEMLTGQPPFARRNRAETMRAVMEASADWSTMPKETPLAIQELIRRCFERDPGARLSDAGEARRIIAGAADEARFSPFLYLKSQIWRLSRTTKGLIVWASILTAFVLAWNLTPLGDVVRTLLGKTKNEDTLAVRLAKKVKNVNVEQIRAALTADQQSSKDLLALDNSLRKNRDFAPAIDEIIGELTEETKDGKGSAEVYALLAQSHLFKYYLSANRDDLEACRKDLQTAQSLNPNSFEVQLALCEMFNAIRSPEQTITIMEKARQEARYANDPRGIYALARAYAALKPAREEDAVRLFNEAIGACESQSPGQCAKYYNQLGAFYFFRGQYEKAITNWRSVTVQDSTNPYGFSNLGSALLAQGCFEPAIEAFNNSIRIKPTGNGFRNRGTAYFFRGRFAEAVQDYEQLTINSPAAKQDPSLATSWGYLGDGYRMEGRNEQAIDAYRKGLVLLDSRLQNLPEEHRLIALKAEWIAKLNSLGVRENLPSPTTLINQALKQCPSCGEYQGIAALIYLLSGDRAQALKAAHESVKNGGSLYTLTQNPELKELNLENEFQELIRSQKPSC